jgi:hypothetical protein
MDNSLRIFLFDIWDWLRPPLIQDFYRNRLCSLARNYTGENDETMSNWTFSEFHPCNVLQDRMRSKFEFLILPF